MGGKRGGRGGEVHGNNERQPPPSRTTGRMGQAAGVSRMSETAAQLSQLPLEKPSPNPAPAFSESPAWKGGCTGRRFPFDGRREPASAVQMSAPPESRRPLTDSPRTVLRARGPGEQTACANRCHTCDIDLHRPRIRRRSSVAGHEFWFRLGGPRLGGALQAVQEGQRVHPIDPAHLRRRPQAHTHRGALRFAKKCAAKIRQQLHARNSGRLAMRHPRNRRRNRGRDATRPALLTALHRRNIRGKRPPVHPGLVVMRSAAAPRPQRIRPHRYLIASNRDVAAFRAVADLRNSPVHDPWVCDREPAARTVNGVANVQNRISAK